MGKVISILFIFLVCITLSVITYYLIKGKVLSSDDNLDSSLGSNKKQQIEDAQDSKPCLNNWQCTSWSDCLDGSQSRTCKDTNNCGNANNMPDLYRNCCSFSCGSWSECYPIGLQDRSCSYHQNCKTDEIPLTQRACDSTSASSGCDNCKTTEKCENGRCVPKTCSELNGLVCPNGKTCNQPTNPPGCCLDSCIDMQCGEGPAKTSSDNYLDSLLNEDYTLFKSVQSLDCITFGSICQNSFDSGIEWIKEFTDITFVNIEEDSYHSLAYYSAKKTGQNYSILITMNLNYDRGGCVVSGRSSNLDVL